MPPPPKFRWPKATASCTCTSATTAAAARTSATAPAWSGSKTGPKRWAATSICAARLGKAPPWRSLCPSANSAAVGAGWQPVSMTAVLILIAILLAIAVAVLARRVVNLQRGLDRADARQKAAVNTSRSVHVGKIAEQLAPLLPGFPYNPKDVQWAGGTIDAIVWDGLEEKRDDLDIVFLDVKTGQARLNDR